MRHELPGPQPFLHLLISAQTHPENRGLAAPGLELSFAELQSHATKIALELQARGVIPGDRVLVRAPAHLQAIFALALWALRAVGGVLPSQAAWSSLPRIDWVLSVDPTTAPASQMLLLDDAFFSSAFTRSEALDIAAYDSGDAPCRLLFSSGTTGIPVAMELSVNALETRCTFFDQHWMPARPYYCLIHLAGSLGVYALNNAMATASAHLVPGTPEDDLEVIRSEFVGHVTGSVAQLDALCAAAEEAGGGLEDLASIHSTGATLSLSLHQRLRRLTDAPISSAYGSTEAGPIALGAFDEHGVLRFEAPRPSVAAEVVNDGHLPLARGETGLLRVRSDSLLPGYLSSLGRVGAYRDGWFYPGDLATMSTDGTFTLGGRSSEVANFGGVKIDPSLVDAAAVQSGDVDDAALLIVDDAEGSVAILAVVCASNEIALEALRAAQDAAFGMAITTAWRIPQIPRTHQGKVRRAELVGKWQSERRPRGVPEG